MLWLREVNKSVKDYLQNVYKEYNIPIKVRSVKTYVSEEQIPCIMLTTFDSGDNIAMTDVNSLNVNVRDSVATISKKHTKRNITVQIDFFTESVKLLDELTYKFVTSKTTHDTIDITDSNGNVYVCNCTIGQPQRFDFTEEDVVLNRVTFIMNIVLPLQIGKPQVVGVVETTNPTISKKKED